MRGEQLELELLAQEIRRRAGLHDDELAVATRIAARLLGPEGITANPNLTGPAYLRRTDEGWQIVVNPGARDVRFHVAHEIGEWALKTIARFDGGEADRERAANYIAAALLAPEAAVRRVHAAVGERVKTIASRFQMSQTAIVLRLAEVQGDERAVVTRNGNVLVRTQGAFPWADVPLIDVARGARWRGLAKTQLRGGLDEGRVALRVR